MPPWAAFEWERTGWTFDRIPTETPCSAAASAARCPASPAPITSTSCWGKARASLWDDFQRLRSRGFDHAGQHLDHLARRQAFDDRESFPGREARCQTDRGLETAGPLAAAVAQQLDHRSVEGTSPGPDDGGQRGYSGSVALHVRHHPLPAAVPLVQV